MKANEGSADTSAEREFIRHGPRMVRKAFSICLEVSVEGVVHQDLVRTWCGPPWTSRFEPQISFINGFIEQFIISSLTGQWDA